MEITDYMPTDFGAIITAVFDLVDQYVVFIVAGLVAALFLVAWKRMTRIGR